MNIKTNTIAICEWPELRTPIHGITAMSRELQDSLLPSAKANQAVAIIAGTLVATAHLLFLPFLFLSLCVCVEVCGCG
jgi:hypothetical protein